MLYTTRPQHKSTQSSRQLIIGFVSLENSTFEGKLPKAQQSMLPPKLFNIVVKNASLIWDIQDLHIPVLLEEPCV